MNKFIFDVDGTLTSSRQSIDPEFRIFFLEFCRDNEVYLVTGSDYAKTVEQLGEDIVHRVKAVYNCSGNDVWQHGENIKRKNWTLPEEPRKLLQSWLDVSRFSLRTGNHFEDRPGTCNFSIVGRGATKEQRAEYVKWDTEKRERYEIAEALNKMFPDVEATVAGEIGIDIYKRGKDKAQVADVLSPFVFFGDKTGPGGNDHTISLRADKVHSVYGWSDTWQVLRFMYPTENT